MKLRIFQFILFLNSIKHKEIYSSPILIPILWGMDTIELLKYINNFDKNFLTSKLGKFLISKANEFQKIFEQEKLGDDFLMVAKKL